MIGIFTGILLNSPTGGGWSPERIGLLAGSVIVFALGLYDDFRRLTPPAKLVGQILAATVAIFYGYTTNFFTPRIQNPILAQLPNIILTYIWLVGITNAINLLDNMDGLAGGISLITALILSFFFWDAGDLGLVTVSLALAGGVLGFLLYNFPPASIFMGDSGSLFLGFTLAVLAIARQPQASHVFAILGVPTLVFLLPILDTVLVTITRILRGESPAKGGRDHTSHRLIAFGLTERQAVLVLYGVALLSGLAALAVESLEYWLSLVFVPILVVLLALLTAYLGRMQVISAEQGSTTTAQSNKAFARIFGELAYRRRLFEIALDLILIGVAYYLAMLTAFGFSVNEALLDLFLRSLPLAYLAGYLSFFLNGVYRPVWEYLGVSDLINYIKATAGAALILTAAIAIFFSFDVIPVSVVLLFSGYLFIGLTATRSSFRILDALQKKPAPSHVERVLIYGADNSGELAARWILMNPQFGYRAIGFLDSDPFLTGRQIHGINILGGPEDIEAIFARERIDGLVITGEAPGSQQVDALIAACRTNGCWVRVLKLEFDLLE
jgi:UDP-GlcNAc:undecaprenyl-phosphate GlcNAc-1-phosphate transferase